MNWEEKNQYGIEVISTDLKIFKKLTSWIKSEDLQCVELVVEYIDIINNELKMQIKQTEFSPLFDFHSELMQVSVF